MKRPVFVNSNGTLIQENKRAVTVIVGNVHRTQQYKHSISSIRVNAI